MVAPSGMFSTSDVMPDLFSNSSIFNAGNFQSTGYSASVIQKLGENLSASLTIGSMGALTTTGRELVSNNPDDLRSMIHAGRKTAATGHVDATVPGSGKDGRVTKGDMLAASATNGPETNAWP